MAFLQYNYSDYNMIQDAKQSVNYRNNNHAININITNNNDDYLPKCS